jgi:hypothetical protein
MRAFEAECKKIVNDISDKFLDLGLDEGNNGSDYGNLMQKQEKFSKEFERLNFQFDSHSLHLPKGKADNEEIMEEEDRTIDEMHTTLGSEIDRIHDLIHKSIKH